VKLTDGQKKARAEKREKRLAQCPHARIANCHDKWGVIVEFEEGYQTLRISYRGDAWRQTTHAQWKDTTIWFDRQELGTLAAFLHAGIARYNAIVQEINTQVRETPALERLEQISAEKP